MYCLQTGFKPHPRGGLCKAVSKLYKVSLVYVGLITRHVHQSNAKPTMVPWKEGKLLVWYAPNATRETGAVASQAEEKKRGKYAHLVLSHSFTPYQWTPWGYLVPNEGPWSPHQASDRGLEILLLHDTAIGSGCAKGQCSFRAGHCWGPRLL